MTTFHHFVLPQYPRDVARRGHLALVELLEPFGIVLSRPDDRTVIYSVDEVSGNVMRRSGSVYVRADGVIEAVPHRGSIDADRCALLQTAHLAFLHKPTKRDGWTLHRAGGATS